MHLGLCRKKRKEEAWRLRAGNTTSDQGGDLRCVDVRKQALKAKSVAEKASCLLSYAMETVRKWLHATFTLPALVRA